MSWPASRNGGCANHRWCQCWSYLSDMANLERTFINGHLVVQTRYGLGWIPKPPETYQLSDMEIYATFNVPSANFKLDDGSMARFLEEKWALRLAH